MPVLPSTNGAARVCYNLCRSEGDIWQCRDILCLQGSGSEFDQEFLWLQKRTFLVSAGSPAAINQPRSQSSHSRPRHAGGSTRHRQRRKSALRCPIGGMIGGGAIGGIIGGLIFPEGPGHRPRCRQDLQAAVAQFKNELPPAPSGVISSGAGAIGGLLFLVMLG